MMLWVPKLRVHLITIGYVLRRGVGLLWGRRGFSQGVLEVHLHKWPFCFIKWHHKINLLPNLRSFYASKKSAYQFFKPNSYTCFAY